MNHRKRFSIGLIALLLLAMSALAGAPKLISYQGKATDAAGQPVADGSHPVQFHIFDKLNNLYWTESATVTTAGGLFSHNLGSVTPLIPGQFAWRDSLFLQVTFEGQIQLPRTTFTASPYALAVNSIDGSLGGIITGDISVHSNPADDEVAGIALDGSGNPNLWMKDIDGTDRIKLDMATRSLQFVDGEITSTPATITSHGDTLVLGAGKVKVKSNLASVTGQLDLDGTADCWINPNAIGSSSVYLPDDGINNREIKDEPGIAQAVLEGWVTLGHYEYEDILTVSISIPAPGYIMLTAKTNLRFVNPEVATTWVQIDETAGGLESEKDVSGAWAEYAPGEASGSRHPTVNCHRVYFKFAAGSYTFRLKGVYAGVPVNAENSVLTAVFIPTSYGSVETMVSSNESKAFERAAASSVDGSSNYKVDLRELELRAAKAEADAERAKRELLEAQIKK